MAIDDRYDQLTSLGYEEDIAAKLAVGAAIASSIQRGLGAIAVAIDNLDVRSDHPLQGETLSGIEGALRSLSDSTRGIAQGLQSVAESIDHK